MADQLSKLTKKADAVAESASVLVSRAIREITGEMANLSRELNLSGNADDRDRVYEMIRRKMNRLGRNLNRLLVAQNQAAAQGAAKAASDMTGVGIKYSAQRAKAICELVTPAQGENLAAVFTDKMGANMINTLREATVSALRDNAVAGGTMKELAADMRDRWFDAFKGGTPTFTDVAGREWDTRTYFQMNVRTNTMRVYNDCLVDNVAREVGTDLMRISAGGDPNCPLCSPWEGCIVSISGKTKGLPTYDEARRGGCFHPNCTHTLEYVDEVADADEIELQKANPVTGDATDADAQDERRYQIDQARYRQQGMTADQARVAVDRDNLAASIRHGLVRADAEDMVAKMTDAQVTALCPNGNPPAFAPVKRIKGGTRKEPKYEAERWNHGRRGGVVHIDREADLAHILAVTKADAQETSGNGPAGASKATDAWKPTTELERSTDALMAAIGAKHTDANLLVNWRSVNPDYKPHTKTSVNCQRVAPTVEARFRGYDVVAKPAPSGRIDDFYTGLPYLSDEILYPAYKNPKAIPYNKKSDIEKKMAEWGDGSRAEIGIAFKGGSAHAFFAIQKDGKTIFIDAQGYDGSPDNPRKAEEFFNRMTKRGRDADRFNNFCRVDNLEFSDRAKLAFSAGNNV